jgi:SAM-dependent methyltransferase
MKFVIILILIIFFITCALLLQNIDYKLGGKEIDFKLRNINADKKEMQKEMQNTLDRRIVIREIKKNSPNIKYWDEILQKEMTYSLRAKFLCNMKSNEQIKTLIRFGSINEYARLIQLLGKYIKEFQDGAKRARIISNLIMNKTDSQIYQEICDNHFSRNEDLRAEGQANALFRPIAKYMKSQSIESFERYLDVGCNIGTITVHMKELFGAKETMCIEADLNVSNANLKYHYVDQKSDYVTAIPNEHIDIATAFMSLHHIENIKAMIKEIHRVLKSNGILYIKEHDTNNFADALLVDIEHAVFMKCNDKVEPAKSEFFCHYKNYAGWDEEFKGLFTLIKSDFYYVGIPNNISPTRAYWAIYKKI